MKEQLESLFESWINPATRDNKALAELYSKVFKKEIDKCPKCKSKAITDLRKYYNATYNQAIEIPTGRKYVLKPGNHQFVPGERTHHNNENSTDAALAAYLKAFPYIRQLFERIPQ
jgi:hypothetical protein